MFRGAPIAAGSRWVVSHAQREIIHRSFSPSRSRLLCFSECNETRLVKPRSGRAKIDLPSTATRSGWRTERVAASRNEQIDRESLKWEGLYQAWYRRSPRVLLAVVGSATSCNAGRPRAPVRASRRTRPRWRRGGPSQKVVSNAEVLTSVCDADGTATGEVVDCVVLGLSEAGGVVDPR